MTAGTKISVVTVCMNAAETLQRTMDSVLSQTYTGPVEYIIKDGSSTDDTVEIAESYREKFEKRGISFRVISAPDAGIYDAMNRGIKETTGDLVGLLNADDIYEPGCLETVAKRFKETDFDLCFGDIRMLLPSGRSFIKKARNRRYTTSRDWNHPTQFVRRSLYDRYSYRCENISDDMDLYFAIRKSGAKIEVINEVLADFTMGGVSSSIPIREVPERIMRRYRIYRRYDYSRLYMLECVGFELVKYIGSKL